MERMRDRLADRDLEIKILHKRMSLRRGHDNEPEKTSKISTPCTKCQEKDSLVSDLYQKLRNLENIIEAFCSPDEKMGKSLGAVSKASVIDADLDQVIETTNLRR